MSILWTIVIGFVAGLIGATVGALLVLFIWHLISRCGHASST